MELIDAINLIWCDVADGVLRQPTIAEALEYARDMQTVELSTVLDDQRDGRYDAHPDNDVVGDVYGAYVDVRSATSADLARASAKLSLQSAFGDEYVVADANDVQLVASRYQAHTPDSWLTDDVGQVHAVSTLVWRTLTEAELLDYERFRVARYVV